ncbi:MAG: hypothetical protein NT062_18885 [Proteobacteria bacterium]|nr:hypothetical protein [Pseudomonadota bacterium]
MRAHDRVPRRDEGTQLAAHVAHVLRERLAAILAAPHVRALEVTVEETPGQGSSCTISLR